MLVTCMGPSSERGITRTSVSPFLVVTGTRESAALYGAGEGGGCVQFADDKTEP